MFIVLDNAESILDPKEPGAKEIYPIVDELCQFKKLSLCITSRITMVPPRCKRPQIPTLSMEAASDIFYGIYGDNERSSVINDLLRRLDFHALSIKLLATTASHNAWDYDRLSEEWDAQRAQVLQTEYNESLAATIELSLASPTFLSLGTDAHSLLGVVAFFPHGVYEKNVDWLFPTIIDRKHIFDKFCILSLTYRTNGFITMLAPLRDYLSPQDPLSSSLLCATRDRYFTRLSVDVSPGMPGFGAAQWIMLEDVNVEHLLDVLASLDQTRSDIWNACFRFMEHLVWHKPRQTILGPKIEALADDHPSKPECLSQLSRLFYRTGNRVERKRLLVQTLELRRRVGDVTLVAHALKDLSDINRWLNLHEEGIQQAKEALAIFERTNDTAGQAHSLDQLAALLLDDKQLDAAENAASRAIDLVSAGGQDYLLCRLHRVLGQVHRSKGEKEKAIHHINTATGIASNSNWHDVVFCNRIDLAQLLCDGHEFEAASAHIEQTKSLVTDDPYRLGCAVYMQAYIWYRQGRFGDAKSEFLHALGILEKLGAVNDVEYCKNFLQNVEQAIQSQSTCS